METWFKSDAQLPNVGYEPMASLSQSTGLPDPLSMSTDFTHCLEDKLPLELLAVDGEVVQELQVGELQVQLDDKNFSSSHEEVHTVLSSEEAILFEEVRDTPSSPIQQDDRETLLAIQTKLIDTSKGKIMLLTPHELESMRVSALESDSEKESLLPKTDAGTSSVSIFYQNEQPLLPLTVTHGNEILYACPVQECSKGFRKLCMAKSHISKHFGVREFKCDADGCTWAFFSEHKLKRHKESHEGKKDFACAICRRRFSTLYNLNSHKKLHARPNSFVCSIDQCKYEFQTQRDLDNHLKELHRETEAPYSCPQGNCSKRFYSLNALTTHLRSHTRVGPLLCQWQGCTRSFDRPSHLESHMRTHTGDRPFVCHYEGCGWAFRTPSKLSRHQRTHKNERPFKCPQQDCHKAYLRSEHLKQHLLTQHQGLKMFRCPVENCGAEFTARSTLYVHAKRHNVDSANVTYPCEHPGCNKQYSGKSNLRKHMLRCHGNRIKTVARKGPEQTVTDVQAPAQTDYIALLLSDDDQTVDRSIVTFLAVPAESLQDGAPGSNDTEPNVCLLLHTADSSSSQEAAPSSSGRTQVVCRWQGGANTSTEECGEFSQSTINMRDLE